ncbi:MAG: hypothetical protein WD696_03845 [Bryobacteraceae bacterium]
MRYLGTLLLFFAAAGVNCGFRSGPSSEPLGEAFVGPAELKLREEISLESKNVATLAHGDRVELVGRRRRFWRVRTEKGVQGWTHQRQLLSSADMEDLRKLHERAEALPSQGKASTYELLNVHTEANRTSPSFTQLREGDKVDVLAQKLTPRGERASRPLIPPTPPAPPPARKPASRAKYPPPPMPTPPSPPENWLELSRSPFPKEEEAAEPVPMDDWSLIRTAAGKAGWVLRSRVYMAIPDEVAQYAEGKRITSYFSLGEVRAGDEPKHNWLWTTIEGGNKPYDFDSFRVFIWSLRRNRYETAYIERNRVGHFPVKVHEVDLPGPQGSVKYPGFSICMENPDGGRYRRSYAFIVNVVRFAGETPCEKRPAQREENLLLAGEAAKPAEADPPFYRRWIQNVDWLRRHWLGN